MHREGWSAGDTFAIATAAGEIHPTVTAPGYCRIRLGSASTTSKDFPDGPPDGAGELRADERTWRFQHVSVGNPQCSIYVEREAELEELDLAVLGPPIEAHELFPNRTNVSWYTDIGPAHPCADLRARRGGDARFRHGAAGAAVAHVLRTGGGARELEVALDGGTLDRRGGRGPRDRADRLGEAEFRRELSEELLEALRDAHGQAQRADA